MMLIKGNTPLVIQYLLGNYSIPVPMLDAGNTVVNKTFFAFKDLTLVEE